METLRFRQIHMDFHTSEWIPQVAEEFDGNIFAQTLSDAHVNSVTCFARCHHGWLYYNSKNMKEWIHPNLKNSNLLLEQIQSCHQKNIKVPIYTSVQWDGRLIKSHPEWLCKDENGNPINSQGNPDPHFYYSLCLNSGYREFFKAHMQDIIDSLGEENIDGFFLDILLPIDCHCKECLSKMKKEGFDEKDKVQRLAYSQFMLDEFKEEITELVHSQLPQVSLFYNSSHIGLHNKKSLSSYTHLELESLPSGGWGYDHFPATVRYARGLGKELIGMTGKFHTFWGDFHSLKNQAALEFECFQMISLGTGCSIGDQMHPSGTLSKGAYDRIKNVYSLIHRLEPYLAKATPVAEIGVLSPEEFAHLRPESTVPSAELVGCVRMLQELGYQFDILDSQQDFSKYPVILLPDTIDYSPQLEEKLLIYLNQGGRILGSYESLLQKNKKEQSLYGIDYLGDSPYDRTFVLPNDYLGKTLEKEPYVMYLRGTHIQEKEATVLMDTVAPYFNREGERFCSHQHTPSSGKKGTAAVTQKNQVIYFAHPIFSIYRKNAAIWCKQMVKDALEILHPHSLLRHDGPSTLMGNITHQKKESRYILHFLHYITEKRSQDIFTIEDVIPLFAQKVEFFMKDKTATAVLLLPEKTPLSFCQEKGYVRFTVPKINGYQPIEIQYEENSSPQKELLHEL